MIVMPTRKPSNFLLHHKITNADRASNVPAAQFHDRKLINDSFGRRRTWHDRRLLIEWLHKNIKVI
ncbi:hypothetical protein DY000_02018897 [Brassica cretica]|uniref:Uncharacterized protein n=1 Tax=Brassica cretica TaxID=69181 RepID=A0ABQ7D7F4_BRACR|nr:hypothetical protein DY000_02018897 [Brassica cretica]